MNPNIHVSVIIPAHNEAARISSTLEAVRLFLSKKSYTYEILVVDDGSTDETADVVKGFIFSIPSLRIVTHEKNSGKGSAVRTGILEAKGDFRLFMDADNSSDIKHLDDLILSAEKGNDIVIGSRYISGSRIDLKQGIARKSLGKIFRLLVRCIMPVGVCDTQNGFKLFSARCAADVFFRLKTRGWAFDVEVLTLARRFGYSIKEVPISWRNDERSHVTLSGMFRMLTDIIKMRLSL